MNKLKHIWLTLIQLIKQVFGMPRGIADAVKQKRLRAVANEHEIERLDRIRNPSKYLGK